MLTACKGNGANQSWPAQFGLQDENGNWVNDKAVWIYASVNAITYLAASIFGCW
jgi:hypothetical protein